MEKKIEWFCPKCASKPEETFGGSFKIIDTDDWNWKVLEFRATAERRKAMQDFLQKWGAFIGLGIIAMVFIITMYLTIGYVQDVINGGLGACAQARNGASDAPVGAAKAEEIKPFPLLG